MFYFTSEFVTCPTKPYSVDSLFIYHLLHCASTPPRGWQRRDLLVAPWWHSQMQWVRQAAFRSGLGWVSIHLQIYTVVHSWPHVPNVQTRYLLYPKCLVIPHLYSQSLTVTTLHSFHTCVIIHRSFKTFPVSLTRREFSILTVITSTGRISH